MYFPSGAQLGDVNSLFGSFETCFAPVPSGWMIQMFSLPSRSETKAIHCPSGENLGWLSNAIPPEISFACPPSIGSVKISPTSSNAIVFASGETSSESQVPSSVVNSIFRSDFSGSPFFSSFLSVFFSSFFSSFLSFSCPGAPCSLAPALRTAWPPKKAPAIIVKTASHAVLRRLGCFALMLIPPYFFQIFQLEFTDRQYRGQSA